jgi:hypothetical protein
MPVVALGEGFFDRRRTRSVETQRRKFMYGEVGPASRRLPMMAKPWPAPAAVTFSGR